MTGFYIISNTATANAQLHFCSEERPRENTQQPSDGARDVMTALEFRHIKVTFTAYLKGWKFTDNWGNSTVFTLVLRRGNFHVFRSFSKYRMSEIVHHKHPSVSNVHIAAIKAQCPLNQGGDSSTGMLSHQLSLYRTCLYWGWHYDFKRKTQTKVSCPKQTITSAADERSSLLWGWATKSIWDAQNGCSETNIIRRMMELPLKLMTLLTVTISRSSTTSLGPLMGRDKTRVALTLLVCWRRKKTGGEREERSAGSGPVWQLHMMEKIQDFLSFIIFTTSKHKRKVMES